MGAVIDVVFCKKRADVMMWLCPRINYLIQDSDLPETAFVESLQNERQQLR